MYQAARQSEECADGNHRRKHVVRFCSQVGGVSLGRRPRRSQPDPGRTRQLPARSALHAWPWPEMARQASTLVKARFRGHTARRTARTVASACAPSRLGQPSAITGQGYGIMLMIRVCLVAVSLSARIIDLASVCARWVATRGWMLLGAAALCIASPALMPVRAGPAHAGIGLEERKLPMKFGWVTCQPNCRGWISAVGIVTADTPRDFDEFARGRQLGGATIVLDSSGGSVNDSIALGRRWRSLGALTTVGTSVQTTVRRASAGIAPMAYCESMC